MSLRLWAIKVGELKPLSREGALLFGVRCALRVERWRPPGGEATWRRGLGHVMAAACKPPASPTPDAALYREVSDSGAIACNRLAKTDEPLGQCMNYTTQALCAVLTASAAPTGAPFKKAIIDAAKYSASIPAVLAHAGRVVAPRGEAPVDHAARATWDAIRADIAVVSRETERIRAARDPLVALRACAPLWPNEVPAWFDGR